MKYVGLALAIALAACGPSSTREPDANNNGSGSGSGSGSGNGSGDCSDAAKLVYTVDMSNQFSQFDPATKSFRDLGTLSCPSSGSPFSMGVDRNTVAWVLYDSGELFRVDILNSLACTKTSWASQGGLTQFGMGFSTDTAGG